MTSWAIQSMNITIANSSSYKLHIKTLNNKNVQSLVCVHTCRLVKPKLKWVICDVSVMQVWVVHETPCERIVGHRSRDIVMVLN